MYGVPASLDLSKFKGATLTQLGIGEFQVQFIFDPVGAISVEGLWQLRDPAGALIDQGDGSKSITEKGTLQVHAILGKEVTAYAISAPDSFSLHFESNHILTIFDNSGRYESFSIGNVIV